MAAKWRDVLHAAEERTGEPGSGTPRVFAWQKLLIHSDTETPEVNRHSDYVGAIHKERSRKYFLR